MLRLWLTFLSNHLPTTKIYTLSLHDAFRSRSGRLEHGLLAEGHRVAARSARRRGVRPDLPYVFLVPRSPAREDRSEEHTSELQSHSDLVCRLLLEKKKD